MANSARLLRSFIAIPLPKPLQRDIAGLQAQLRQQLPQLKTPRAENLHLTLHFLGDQPEELLAKIGQLMLSIGRKSRDFHIDLEGLGVFPNRKRPRILWLGIKPEQALQQLYQNLASGLLELGVTIEQRQYRPHLTIGRFRQPPGNTELLCPFLSHRCGRLHIDRMILYQSELTQRGAIHTPLETALLMLTGA